MQPWPPIYTDRETEVLQGHCDGYTGPEISKILGITYKSVRNTLDSARAKTGNTNVTRTVIIALHFKKIKKRYIDENRPMGD